MRLIILALTLALPASALAGGDEHTLDLRGEYTFASSHGGGAALLQIESYYCHPEGSGCMTLRYRLQR